MYIGIAGNIGSGKSAMAKLLKDEFDWDLIEERSAAENPYLSDFYANMPRWALNLQVNFLTSRFKAVQRAMWSEKMVVQDRTIYEDANVFVENLLHMGIMSAADYNTYQDLFRVLSSFVSPPELLIYMKASVPSLRAHIRQRGIAHENSISYEYLAMLNARYDEWAAEYTNNMLTIDVDDIDFVNNATDREKVVAAIRGHLKKWFETQANKQASY